MATIDLTLGNFIVPRMSSFTPPWGTVQTDPDHPGLSTQELINDMMMAFNRMRPLVVTETSTTTEVQADASLILSGGITSLTLGQGAYKNVSLTIENNAADDVVLLNGSKIITCTLGEILELRWNGTEWRVKTNKLIGDFIEQRPSEKSPDEKCLEGTWVDWSDRAVLYGISDAAPPEYVDYYSLVGSAIAANTTPVVCYHKQGDDYRLYKFKSQTAAYTVPAELDPVKWDYITPGVIDTRESCQKLNYRDSESQEIVVTDDLQIGSQITAGIYAGKYITEVMVPGGKFFSVTGGFRPPFVSGGVQGDAIRDIQGGFAAENQDFVTDGAFEVIKNRYPPTSAGFRLYWGDYSMRLRASRVVPTGSQVRPVNLSTRLWRRIS
ncbi:MAG: hypothetical protein LBQ14_07190, partial [Treponema sp.]|nr:hypothetical protein [Treponema sp.]